MTRVIGVLAVVTLFIVDSMRVQAQEKPVQLEEVVVTATKTETPVAQTGASVTVIKREEVERKQATDAVQILREQPGFSLIQTGGRGQLNATIFIRGGNNDMNLVLIDGMKVNQGGGFFDYRDLTTTGVGTVEIVRGPQSALYGADAMTGVIQFFTPRGRGPFSAWASAGAGNYDTTEERVGFSWGNKLAGAFFEFDRVDTTGISDKNNEYRNHTGVL
ncbi:MAG: TonB-dependent outer membrane receptor for cobalamin and Fe transport, partial [bacterium]